MVIAMRNLEMLPIISSLLLSISLPIIRTEIISDPLHHKFPSMLDDPLGYAAREFIRPNPLFRSECVIKATAEATRSGYFIEALRTRGAIGDSEAEFIGEYGSAVEKADLEPNVIGRTFQFRRNGKEFRIYAVFFDNVCHVMAIEAAYGRPLEDATIASWLQANAAHANYAGSAWISMPPKPSQLKGTRIWVRRDRRYEVLTATYEKNGKGLWNLTFETGKGMDWFTKRREKGSSQ